MTGFGIEVGAQTSNVSGSVIANNTIFTTGNEGVDAEPNVPGLTINNNIVLNTGQYRSGFYGISVCANSSASSDVVMNNLIYGSSAGPLCLNGASNANNITNVNPASGTLFVNWQSNGSGDYHLQASSPALHAGTTPFCDWRG